MTHVELIGLPIIWLGTIWGVFKIALSVSEILDDRRDCIISKKRGEKDLNRHDMNVLLWSDWIPFWCLAMMVMATVSVVLFAIPSLFDASAAQAREFPRAPLSALMPLPTSARYLCYAIGAMPGIAVVTLVLTGYNDLRAIRKAIQGA